MIRLKKDGLIREVETADAAAPYLDMGYEILDEPDEEGETDGESGTKRTGRGKGAGKPA